MPASNNFEYAEELAGAWLMYSVGPDMDEFNRINQTGTIVSRRVYVDYDPTNGTVSVGNVFRTQSRGDQLGVNPFFTE